MDKRMYKGRLDAPSYIAPITLTCQVNVILAKPGYGCVRSAACNWPIRSRSGSSHIGLHTNWV